MNNAGPEIYAVECLDVRFSHHALLRMAQRGISQTDVMRALLHGVIVEKYPEDAPYPSQLLLAWSVQRPLHIVVAKAKELGLCIVITVYIPESDHWNDGWMTRREKT
ncbi:MAG: DUF4258 domain-containing protein [Magnetococcales bacterium]|nr:DUF4258 domain-containing protein [Magnetococcales bacterium]